MTTRAAAGYSAARRPLTSLLDSVAPLAWAAPSPCDGWTARDVVGHLVETQRELFGRHGVELGAAPNVAADPAAAWQAHAQAVEEVIADDAVADMAFDSYFGPTTLGATLLQFYVFDMVAHRWDVARAVGVDAALTDTELDLLDEGASSFGDALYMEGVCAPGVEPAADAGREATVLARLGRQA